MLNYYSCRLCAMTHNCHLEILQSLFCHNSWKLLHRILLLQKGFPCHLFCFAPYFLQLCYYLLMCLFTLFLFYLPQKLAALWSYSPQLLHAPLKKLVLLLFISPEFNDRTLPYGYFYCSLLMSRSVL